MSTLEMHVRTAQNLVHRGELHPREFRRVRRAAQLTLLTIEPDESKQTRFFAWLLARFARKSSQPSN